MTTATAPALPVSTKSGRILGENRERLLIAVASYLVYVVYALTRWRQHRVAGFDLGIFDQVVRNYAHLEAPIVSLKGPNFNALGDHFHPILVTLAPLYRIWDDARVLLIAQGALVAISVWVVHGFAARHLDRRTAAFAAVAYALGWPLQQLVDFDFHEIAFAIPLLAVAIDALDRRSDRALIVASVLLLLTREDMGLIVFCLGLLRVLRRPRLPGLVLIGLGPLTYFAATSYVLPHFAGGSFGYWTYRALGPDLPSALGFIVTHPLATLGLFVSPSIKVTKLFLLLAPVAFLALRSRYFLLAVPLLGQSLLSSRPDLWGTRYHHSSVLWPIIFLAAIHGAVLLGLPARRWSWRAVRTVVVAFPVLGVLLYGGLHPLQRLLDGDAFRTTSRMIDHTEMINAIPPDTCVIADDRIAVFLTHTNRVSGYGQQGWAPDFFAVDRSRLDMGGPTVGTQRVLEVARDAGYTLVKESGSVVLLQRPGYRGPSAKCAPT